MKKSLASFSPSLDLPHIPKTLANAYFTNQNTTTQPKAFSQSVTHPTEEMINYLNRIGHEYPFCVNNKIKMNDPL